MQAQTRQWLVTAHRWLGLCLLLWFVLLGLTGSVLVFQDEIDTWLNPHLLIDSAPAHATLATGAKFDNRVAVQLRTPQAILQSASQAFPQAAIERIRMPAHHGDVYRLLLREQARIRIGSPRLEATFSPVSAAPLGTRPLDGYGLSNQQLIRTIYDLHHRVLLGNTGKTAVGIVGALLLAMITLGLLVALPRKRGGRAWRTMIGIKLGAHRARLIFDLHRSVGVIAFALLLISTFTGFAMAFPDYARTLPVVPFVQRQDLPNAPLDTLLDQARLRHPDALITEVHLPQRRSSPLTIYMRDSSDWQRRGDTLLLLDPATGVAKLDHAGASRSVGERIFHSLFPIHSGVAWGTLGRMLMFIAGLLPLCLGVTGVLIWWRKQAAARVARHHKKSDRAAGLH
jgi:uncharacterized iron-regulated membrane protein